MADLRIVDAPVLLQESITDDVKMPTGGLGNFSIRLGDIVWYVVTKEQLANKNYVDLSSKDVQDKLDAHIANKNNPHDVTKEQVGLGNVDNTADVDKPVSDATKSAIITATNDMATKTYVNQQGNLKADKATTLSGYGITDAYTKDETINELSLKANISYVDSKDGDLATLTTADKTNLVKAVNEVNDKTAIFYNTVADMVADTKLKAGKAIITHGYWSANDGGGARYLIKDTATEYSIPVANGLHAVFADSFDIRKFGIRNNATLNQTKEIERMCRYADISGTYEIDFLSYSLQVPKTRTMTTQWGIDTWNGQKIGGVMGMAFEKVHKLKNLFITHDKTVRLETAMCMILFTPLADAPYEQWFKFDNVTFDAWVDNYQPLTDNYLGNGDGFRHGFIAVPKKGAVGIADSQLTPCNYSFDFSNIRFASPAYSYNLLCCLHAKTTKFNNLTGDYLGLYLHPITQNLIGSNIQSVYRDDLRENNRTIVTNAIHVEAEFGGKNVTQKMIDVSNISSIRKTTGKAYSAFVYHCLAKLTIDSVSFNNMEGYVGFGAYGENYINVNKVNYTNCTRDNALQLINCSVNDELYIDNWKMIADPPKGSYGAVIFLMRNLYTKKMTIKNSEIYRTPTTPYLETYRVIDEMVLENTKIGDNAWIDDQLLTIKKITARNVTLLANCVKLFNCKFETADLDNITYTSGDPMLPIMENSGSNIAVVNASNLNVPRLRNPYASTFYGNMTVNLKSSNFITDMRYDNATVTVNLENVKLSKQVTYDPPSLATATQQSQIFWLGGARIGNNVVVSFDKPLQGTRMWGEVTADNQVLVYHRNDTGVTVDLPNGTLTVKIV